MSFRNIFSILYSSNSGKTNLHANATSGHCESSEHRCSLRESPLGAPSLWVEDKHELQAGSTSHGHTLPLILLLLIKPSLYHPGYRTHIMLNKKESLLRYSFSTRKKTTFKDNLDHVASISGKRDIMWRGLDQVENGGKLCHVRQFHGLKASFRNHSIYFNRECRGQ